MRRFYREAKAVALEAAEGGGFGITLDGRRLRTPAKAALILPNLPLAKAIAAEWQAQGDEVRPDTMPLMRLAATAIDRVAMSRERVVGEIASYGASDLLCYRAERPEALVARQEATWQPVLEWLERRYGARLHITRTILAIPQEDAALARLREVVAARSDLALVALHALTTALGSLVLALAVDEGEIGPAAAAAAAHLDELYQAERWGEDGEALARRAAIARDISSTAQFLSLLRS